MKRFCAALLFLVLSGCQLAWDVGNRGGLKSSVAALLSRPAVLDDFRFRMIGTTRSGQGRGRLTSEEVRSIVWRLKLVETKAGEAPGPDLTSYLREGGWTAENLAGFKIFKSERRAETLRLPSGTSFEYFLLLYKPDDGTAVIQTSYAYG